MIRDYDVITRKDWTTPDAHGGHQVLVAKGIKLASIAYDMASPNELQWGISLIPRGLAKGVDGDVVISTCFPGDPGKPNLKAKGTKLFSFVLHPQPGAENLTLRAICDGLATGLFKIEKSLVSTE